MCTGDERETGLMPLHVSAGLTDKLTSTGISGDNGKFIYNCSDAQPVYISVIFS